MGDGFQFLDIILLAMVAAFIFLRLRGVLGKRTGHEQQPRDEHEQPEEDWDQEADQQPDNVIKLDNREDAPEIELSPIDRAIADIRQLDRSFDKANFLQQAVSAYEYIVNAFANGDREMLKNLLAEDVYENFERSIAEREAAGQEMSTDIVAIKSADMLEAQLVGRTAELTVKFQTEMISETVDGEGELVGGDPHPRSVTEIWTFSKDMKARDPNWLLIATRSET